MMPQTLLRSLALLTLAAGLAQAAPLGTAFTYQGRLNDGAQPASGIYDLRFAIYDALSGGSTVGSVLTNTATGVTNGLFTVSVDFGATAFDGNARWLAIEVRTNGAGAFFPLTPRQPLSPAPNAIYATKAGTAASATTAATAATANAVAAGSVGTAGLATGAVDSSRIADGAIGTGDLSPAVLSNTFWRLGGNASTTPGTDFVGTADNQPLELKVNGQRALRLEPTATSEPNIVGGLGANTITTGVGGATIAGGGQSGGWQNTIASGAHYGTVGGGRANTVGAQDSTVAGGAQNRATGEKAAVGGGFNNQAGAFASAVGGGWNNQVNSQYSTLGGGIGNAINNGTATIAGGSYNTNNGSGGAIGGGDNNRVTATAASVPGGERNTASGRASLAAGRDSTASGNSAVAMGFTNLASGDNSVSLGSRNVASGTSSTALGDQTFASGMYSLASGYYSQATGIYSAALNYNTAAGGFGSHAAGTQAKAIHDGTFVWADRTFQDFASTGPDQFIIRAGGGVGIGTNNPQASLHVRGTVLAGSFQGSGAGLTSLNGGALADSSITAAKFAPGAVNHLDAPDGSPLNAVQVSTNGLVGIGTNSPQAALHIAGGRSLLRPTLLSTVSQDTGSYSNLFGKTFVALSSNLLAVGCMAGNAVMLVDLTSPYWPTLKWSVQDGTGSYTNLNGVSAVALSSNLLAIAAYWDDAVTLVDVSNPSAPVYRSSFRDGVGGFNELKRPVSLALRGSLLAVGAADDSAVTLVDVSNPAAPAWRATLKHGVSGFNDLQLVHGVALRGNLLAIAAYGSGAVTLVDVANPASPILQATLRDDVNGFTQLAGAAAVAFSGNLLAIAAPGATTLVDVSNPANPVLRSMLRNRDNPREGPYDWSQAIGFAGSNVWTAGFVENDLHGWHVWAADVSNPAAPTTRVELRNGLGEFDRLYGAQSIAANQNIVVLGCDDSFSVLDVSPTQDIGLIAQSWVGIGTAAPLAPLHVRGNLLVEHAALAQLDAERVELGYGAEAGAFGASALGQSRALGTNSTASGFSTASGAYSTALGYSTAEGEYATALGKATASGKYASAMGVSCSATGFASTAFGYYNTAGGMLSLAAGFYSQALHDGSFVWGDWTETPIASTGTNQFLIRASGGVGINTNNPSGAALNVAGTVRARTFQGDGAGLTGVSGSSISTGTVGDARLSSNVALRSGGNTFSGAQVIGGGSLRMSDQEILLRSGTDANHGLGWYGAGKPFAGVNVDGPVLYGWTGGGVGSMNGGQRLALQWDATGSVAVDSGSLNAGSLAPGLLLGGLGSGEGIASKRTAGGNQFALNFYTSFSNRMTILNTGDIGIGTLSPSRRLHVMDGSGPTRAGGSIQVGMASTGGDPKLVCFGDGDYVHIGENGADDTMELKASRFFFTGGNLGIDTNNPAHKIHVAGGAYCNGMQWVNASDRDRKEGFQAVNSEEILNRVAALPLSTWSYKEDPSSRHVGPTAQDFQAAFGFGKDDKAIGTVDADGVALAAIQGLNEKLEIRNQKSEVSIQKLQAENAELKRRLEKLEQLMNHEHGGAR